MLVIGIDPGISGSICFFQDGKIIDVVEMPTMIEGKKNKKQVNGSQIFNEISLKIKKIDKKDIKVVKIDIEGEEISVLNQIIDYGLHNKIHHILVETHQKKIPSQNVELDKLKKRINKMNISNISLEWH